VTDPVRAIADAVLYEGYLLWPYTRSALKNQRRWTWGGVFPPAHAREHPDDPCSVRAQVLLEGGEPDDVTVEVRFLHVLRRADGWEEATERSVGPGPFAIAAGEEEGRSWSALTGRVDVSDEWLDDGLARITVEIRNDIPFAAPPPDAGGPPHTRVAGAPRAAALACALCSTHAIIRTARGAFVSAYDAGDRCSSAGLWPVLVGEGRDVVLASPIILEDHPRIAPESPGDLFDGGEIDGLLALNILALTDEEKAEMRDTDPRARAILERTEALTREQLLRLSGYRASEAVTSREARGRRR
jgi:hypothetical protein